MLIPQILAIAALLSLGATCSQLQARATDVNPCFSTGACQWLNTGVNNCDTAGGSADQQDYCICVAVQKANSSQLADCIACEKTYNATIAVDIQDLSTANCVAILGVATTTSTVAQSTYLLDSQCTAACDPIGSAINACTDDACFCPTLLQYASGCSACWATVNATEATLIASVSAQCVAELSSTGSATAKLTAFGGPSVVVVTVTQSQSSGPTIPIPVTSESSSGTPSSSSSGLSSGAIAGIAVGAAVGALALAGAGFLFYRRGRRDHVAHRMDEPPYPEPYGGGGGYSVEPKPEGAAASSGIRYLDPDAAQEEIPSGRTLNS
jgi:hypothetical protein